MNKSANAICIYLRKKRKECGLSQNELGRALGFKNGQFVSNWERSQSVPANDLLPKLVRLLRIQEVEFLQVLVDESENTYRKILKMRKKAFSS